MNTRPRSDEVDKNLTSFAIHPNSEAVLPQIREEFAVFIIYPLRICYMLLLMEDGYSLSFGSLPHLTICKLIWFYATQIFTVKVTSPLRVLGPSGYGVYPLYSTHASLSLCIISPGSEQACLLDVSGPMKR